MNPIPWEAVQKSTSPGHFPCADGCRGRFLLHPVDTYNVTLGHVRITIVVLESSITDMTKPIVSFPNFANAPIGKELSRVDVGEALLPRSEEQRRNNN